MFAVDKSISCNKSEKAVFFEIINILKPDELESKGKSQPTALARDQPNRQPIRLPITLRVTSLPNPQLRRSPHPLLYRPAALFHRHSPLPILQIIHSHVLFLRFDDCLRNCYSGHAGVLGGD